VSSRRINTDNFVSSRPTHFFTVRPQIAQNQAPLQPRSSTVVPGRRNLANATSSSKSFDKRPRPMSAGRRLTKSQVLNRRAVAKAPTKTPKKKVTNLKANALLGSALLLLIFGGWVGIMGLRANHHVEAQVSTLQASSAATNGSETEGGLPDETKPDPSTLKSYVVDPSLPRFIRIAKLDTYARVKRLGVNTKNELLAPSNTHDAGWYENSAKPGDAGGAMLIDGHVGFTKDGVFAYLKNLQKGDKIEIERGDGQKFSYRVVGSQVYDADKVDMKRALVSAETSKPGLNLITCTGKITPNGTNYSQRLMVFAVAE
jgi:LPXTG-site transpeptidase (sortase) family protein